MPEHSKTMSKSAKADRTDQYLAHFKGFEDSLNGEASAPIHALRRRAIEHFGGVGLPTGRWEQWRSTSIASLARTDFSPVLAYESQALAEDELQPYLFEGLEKIRLVFVNGHFSPELSRLQDLPGGVLVKPLKEALTEDADKVEPHLTRYATYAEEPFTALNTAFLRDGAFVFLPDGAVLEHPVHLLFFSAPSAQPTVSHPRLLLVAGQGSRATLVDSYAGREGLYLTNAVAEMALADRAEIDHYRIQRESAQAFHLSALHVHEGSACTFRSTSIALGARLARNHVHTALHGEGTDSTLNGLYVESDEQHVDNHTLIEHVQPNCASHEFYKGVLDDRATGVFRGKIFVHRAAQKTDAYQANRNLLLSPEADVTTKPQLEIYADDVKCSHGATIGQLDEDAIFYLRSRGVGREEAARLLTHAFALEVVERIKIESVRRRIDELVTGRLAAADYSAG